MAFSQAADVYATDRLSHLAPRSAQTEMERMKPLKAYFGATSLSRLSADSIRQYVAHRKSAKLSNRTVNMEVGCLSSIKTRQTVAPACGRDKASARTTRYWACAYSRAEGESAEDGIEQTRMANCLPGYDNCVEHYNACLRNSRSKMARHRLYRLGYRSTKEQNASRRAINTSQQ
jgi:hypothetical protein